MTNPEMTRITRIEVIDENGRSYVNWEKENNVSWQLQDDGRTLKVFVNKVKPKTPAETDTPWIDCMDGFKYSQEPYPDAMFEEAERRESAHILDKASLKVSQILRISVGEIDKTKFVYLYTLLYNMMGQGADGKPCEEGDENMRHWLNTHNTHLGFCPAAGLVTRMPEIIGYLESFL